MSSLRVTARSKIVSTLTEEILSSSEPGSFLLDSEHSLCRRFKNSRVTIRLALGDLENRGLIFRKHGKGTFAHGRQNQAHKAVGILMKSAEVAMQWSTAEMVRGLHSTLTGLHFPSLSINTSPEQWHPEMGGMLGSLLIFPQLVTKEDMEVIINRKLPYLIVGALPEVEGPKIRVGQEEASYTLTKNLLKLGHRRMALLTAADDQLQLSRLMGVHRALCEAGIDPFSVPIFAAGGDEAAKVRIIGDLLDAQPQFTAVIAFDDTIAHLLSFQARSVKNLDVPRDLSIVSLQELPYTRYLSPTMTSVRFDFFAAGQRAAELLTDSQKTGNEIKDVVFTPVYCQGQTVAAPRA